MAEIRKLQNRTVLTRIGLKIAFALLFASARPNMAEAAEQLLSICAMLSAGLALMFRERWSRSLMTRWDEAAFFLFVSCGLHALA